MLVIAVDVFFLLLVLLLFEIRTELYAWTEQQNESACVKKTPPSLSRISLGNCLFSLSQALLYLFKPAKIWTASLQMRGVLKNEWWRKCAVGSTQGFSPWKHCWTVALGTPLHFQESQNHTVSTFAKASEMAYLIVLFLLLNCEKRGRIRIRKERGEIEQDLEWSGPAAVHNNGTCLTFFPAIAPPQPNHDLGKYLNGDIFVINCANFKQALIFNGTLTCELDCELGCCDFARFVPMTLSSRTYAEFNMYNDYAHAFETTCTLQNGSIQVRYEGFAQSRGTGLSWSKISSKI